MLDEGYHCSLLSFAVYRLHEAYVKVKIGFWRKLNAPMSIISSSGGFPVVEYRIGGKSRRAGHCRKQAQENASTRFEFVSSFFPLTRVGCEWQTSHLFR